MSYLCVHCELRVPLDDVERWCSRERGEVLCLSCMQAIRAATPRLTPAQQRDILREYGVIE